MSSARYIVGDVFDCMAELPDASVDLVLTSPPFLALRSYLPADHPDKAKEIGGEPTPAAFLDTLLHLTAEWRRVLAPHGSICVELGDTYSGSGGAGGDYAEGGMRAEQPKFRAGTARWDGRPEGQVRTTTSDPVSYPARARDGWPMAKSLCGIPHLYHLSLAYGRNLLTGEPSPAGQWRVRNVVAWCRPNPPVGAVGDKFRPATSYMTVATVAKDRYFDLDAVRRPPDQKHAQRRFSDAWGDRPDGKQFGSGNFLSDEVTTFGNPNGVPPYDWWSVPYSADLPDGTDPDSAIEYLLDIVAELTGDGDPLDRDSWTIPTQPYRGAHYATWPTEIATRCIRSMCPPDGTVLDPFAGSGTTLAVAIGEGRNSIGIDIDERNADLARERVGMFLDVEHPEAVA